MSGFKAIKKYFNVTKTTGVMFVQNDSFNYSAGIAFYTIFSLPAILLIVTVVAGIIYKQDVVHTELMHQISFLIGPNGAEEINRIIQNTSISNASSLAKMIGIGTLIFSATTVFVSLQNSLNNIWHIKPKPKREILKFLLNRLMSLAMVICIGFLLLVSLVIDTLLVFLNDSIADLLSIDTYVLIKILNYSISFAVITLVFALIFKVLPDAKIRWKDVWIGALVTAFLFIVGKFLIGFYLGNSNIGNAYGAAGSTVIVLIWVYYSVLIVLFGAQFTYVYSNEIGRKIRPYSNAVKVEIREIEKKK